jgi:hypothetical protein
MKWDALLGRIKVNRKPLSRERLTWWLVIILTRLFGRQVEIRHGTEFKTLRIFPIVWRGRLRLLGSEHEYLQLDYTSPYTARLTRAPDVTVSDGPPVEAGATGSVIHIVVCHLPPLETGRILEYIQSQGDYTVVLAYGGPRENFASISWEHKVFIDDPMMRGLSYLYSYARLIPETRAYLQQQGLAADWIFISDYDLLPLKRNYLEQSVSVMSKHQAGFGAKLIRDLSQSNSFFLANALEEGRVDESLNGPGRSPIYHCLGAVLFFHRDCFAAIFREDRPFDAANLELAVPTAARQCGFRLLSFDKFGDDFKNVRYRPVYSAAEARSLQQEGAAFVHPLKDLETFLEADVSPGTAGVLDGSLK